MSELQTKYPNGALAEEEEIRRDVQSIERYFDETAFGTTQTALLPRGETAQPMVATTSEGDVRVMRWRHDVFFPEAAGTQRGDTCFFMTQGLGESAMILAFNVDLKHEKKLELKDDWSRILSDRQMQLNRFISGEDTSIMWVPDLKLLGQFKEVAREVAVKLPAA